MPNYNARLSKLEEQMGANAPVRFVWMNPGETQLEAVTRYVDEHKLGMHPNIFLAVALAGHAGKIRFVGWEPQAFPGTPT
jgi:hypothetical protein